MTLLIAGIVAFVAIFASGFVTIIGKGALLRARAQTVADAAALAAVAESAPYGRAEPVAAAHRYTLANDGVLIECLCRPGATGAQVTVEVDGVIAEARAILKPENLAPAAGVATGLHPNLASAVSTLVAASEGRVSVVSGFRSSSQQASLWADAVARYGSVEAADDWVAPPGHSMHERGLAVDLGGDLGLAVALIDQLGLPLHRPMAHEPWHFELVVASD